MSQFTCVLINHLTYFVSNDKPLFKELCLSFANEKTGLIGRNGVGKSTLIKLIMGELLPHSGSIETTENISYYPQEFNEILENTVSDVLGVTHKLQALDRIINGSSDENDFQSLNEDWEIKERLQRQLTTFELSYLNLNHQLHTLSGGERTRVILAKTFLTNPSFIILDEPTNNLDSTSRQFLYNAIAQWHKGLLIISHDRTLLNLMDQIVELTSLGTKTYGGNFDAFIQQKTLETNANQQILKTRKENFNKAKGMTQLRKERHEQNESKGQKAKKTQIKAKGCYDKITLKSAKGRSEKTNRRIRLQTDRKLEYLAIQLKTAKDKIEIVQEISIDLPETYVPNGKVISEFINVSFTYDNQKKSIIRNLNFKIMGPERIAFIGDNGSGKTTLIKLLLGELKPKQGTIYIGTERINYLDQNISVLDPTLSILDNFINLNPDINETEARFYLAQFLFRNIAALKLVKNLSGGEKLRAMLACALMSSQPPQLLILDEPTNHLDLDSIASIESALRNYQGALLIISHDQRFLANIDIQKIITGPFNNDTK